MNGAFLGRRPGTTPCVGASGDSINLIKTREDAASIDELADEVIDHLCMIWQFKLDSDEYDETCEWISQGEDSLITIDRRVTDQILFWYYDSVDWPIDVGRHRVRMALLHSLDEFKARLETHGYALAPGGGGYPTLLADFLAADTSCECRMCRTILDENSISRESPKLQPRWGSRLVQAWWAGDEQPSSLVLVDNALVLERRFGNDGSLLRGDDIARPWLEACDLPNLRYLAQDPETRDLVTWIDDDDWKIGADRLLISRDRGLTWEKSSPRGLPEGGTIAFVGQPNARTLWARVRTDALSIWESRNGGRDWRYLTTPNLGESGCDQFATNGETSLGLFTFGESEFPYLAVGHAESWHRVDLPAGFEPNAVVASGHTLACFGGNYDRNGGALGAAYLRSTDSGASWSSHELPGEACRIARVHPRGPWFVSVVAREEGDDDLFVSYDAGATWEPVGSIDAGALFFESCDEDKLWVTRTGTLLELSCTRQ